MARILQEDNSFILDEDGNNLALEEDSINVGWIPSFPSVIQIIYVAVPSGEKV